MGTKIFAYGYLKSGSLFFRQSLSSIPHTVRPAAAKGVLYMIGSHNVPGMQHGSGTVKGELIEYADGSALLIADTFKECFPGERERSMYVREVIEVTLEDGTKDTAWAYIIQDRFMQRAHAIEGGFFKPE